jgi:hypothetical protein
MQFKLLYYILIIGKAQGCAVRGVGQAQDHVPMGRACQGYAPAVSAGSRHYEDHVLLISC